MLLVTGATGMIGRRLVAIAAQESIDVTASARPRGVKTSIVANPAYLDEIERLCDDDGLPFEHISIDAIRC